MDLVFNDISASKTGTNGITSNNEFAVDQAWKNGIVEEGQILNPGDYFDLSYQMTNTGSKSMDVRQQLTVTSDVKMTEGSEAYTLTFLDEEGEEITTITGSLSDDGFSITYDLPDIILDGSAETETGASDGEYIVRLNFSKDAKNAFMNSDVTVAMKAMAKQHRNTTDEHWVEWGEVETKYEQVYTSPVEMISFTIHGAEYQAEEGMTWEQWVESDYDTDGYYYNDDGYLSQDYTEPVEEETYTYTSSWHLFSDLTLETEVGPEDVIKANGEYFKDPYVE